MKIKGKILFYLILSLAAQVYANQYHGILQVFVEDDFKLGKSKTSHYLEINDKLHLLKFKNMKHINSLKLLSGDLLNIDGEMQKNIHGEPLIRVNKVNFSKKIMRPSSREIGNRHALTLLLDFQDKKASSYTSIEKVNKHLYLTKNSVRNVFLTSSFGQLNFVPDTNGDGINDIYLVKLNFSIGGDCSKVFMWARDAKNAVQSQGVDINSYKYFIIVLPNKTNCSWNGLANLGCGTSCYSLIKTGNRKQVYAHELGHNLSFSHSSTDPDNSGRVKSEYGDNSGIMGNNGYHQINAPHRDQAEWYSSYPNTVSEINKTKTVALYSLEKNPNIDSIGLQILKFDRPNILNAKYYLSYRTDTGKYGMSDTYANKVNIHTFKGVGNTLLVKTLSAGELFKDPENGYKVRVKKTNEDFATVRVQMDDICIYKNHPCHFIPGSTFSDLNGKRNYFYIDIPANTNKLTINTEPTIKTNNISLLVKHNRMPTQDSFDCRSETVGNYESCTIPNPKEGKWYVKIDSDNVKHHGIIISSEIE